MTNFHLYECKYLNGSIKEVPYDQIFSGKTSQMKYLIDILNENSKKKTWTLHPGPGYYSFEPLSNYANILLEREIHIYA